MKVLRSETMAWWLGKAGIRDTDRVEMSDREQGKSFLWKDWRRREGCR